MERKAISRYAAVGALTGLFVLGVNYAVNGFERHNKQALEQKIREAYPNKIVRVHDVNGDYIMELIAIDSTGLQVPYVSQGEEYVRFDLLGK